MCEKNSISYILRARPHRKEDTPRQPPEATPQKGTPVDNIDVPIEERKPEVAQFLRVSREDPRPLGTMGPSSSVEIALTFRQLLPKKIPG